MDITYLHDTQKIINELQNICKLLIKDYKYMETTAEEFHMDNGRLLYFLVCLEPESTCYGCGTGAFLYKDGRIFRFHYNIHTPYSKGPHVSNTMTNIEETIWVDRGNVSYVHNVRTEFGREAFWHHTPISCLNEEARTLRTLMASLQAYCRREGYCKKLRRLDKAHEKWEAEKHIKILSENSVYGITNIISKEAGK